MVSIPTISSEFSQYLYDSDVCSIAIVPSHCGLLDINGAIELKLDQLSNLTENQEFKIHSIQGVLFGIEPADSNLVSKITNRFACISDIADSLSIKNVVIGAPEFRLHFHLWQNVLDTAEIFFSGNGLNVFIENLCDHRNQTAHEPFGPQILGSRSFSRALDISNAMNCSAHYQDLVNVNCTYSLIHLSGKDHKSIKNPAEAELIAEILKINGAGSDLVWELNYNDLSQLLDAYKKSIALLRDQSLKL